MTPTLTVHTPDGTYAVHIGRGLLADLGAMAHELGLGGRVVVATDRTVATLHGAAVLAALHAAGFDATLVAMAAGEAHKGWAALDGFIAGFAAAGLDRSGWVLALGGGVVGDTAGLAAALYMRGVPLVQAPTTLLAMADASVGGKVAIDHPLGKNLVGVFKQPRAVVVDLAMLATLPPAEVANGMAEIVKAGLIGLPGAAGARLTALLEATAPPDAELLALAIAVKVRLVEADPFEQGDRALLNLGHTFGHAFERLSGYTLQHGCGVAQGMMTAAHLAQRLGVADAALTAYTARLLAAYGLPLAWGPTLPPATTPADVLAAMATDKKRRHGRLRFVLAHAVGDVRVVRDVPEADVLAALESSRGA